METNHKLRDDFKPEHSRPIPHAFYDSLALHKFGDELWIVRMSVTTGKWITFRPATDADVQHFSNKGALLEEAPKR